jgi:hypothetical protein
MHNQAADMQLDIECLLLGCPAAEHDVVMHLQDILLEDRGSVGLEMHRSTFGKTNEAN